MEGIKHIILVMSGKGGVGKTTVAVNLANSFYLNGKKVGLLDVDVHGPNVPRMLGREDDKMTTADNKMIPIYIDSTFKMVSVGFMASRDKSIIWRGPMKHNIINQFINDVKWDELDYLIVDFPPGTGDECISAAQLLKDSITGAVIVSTPQKVSIDDSIRSIDFCKKMEIPILGLVENMSGGVFGEGTVESICKNYDVPFLGALSLTEEIVNSGNSGELFTSKGDKSKEEFEQIVNKISQD
jgi:ATP-binding protein involved in chromosome partitioning